MRFFGKVQGVLLFMLLLLLLLLCPSEGFLSRFVKRLRFRLPPRRQPHRLPYCPLDKRVKSITTQKKFGREIHEFKRGTRWPYNCLYTSIMQYQGVFNYLPLIHSCCNTCNFPAFTTCISKYGSGWRCPSQGIHCIVNCVKKHDPNSNIVPKPKKKRPSPKRFRRSRMRRKLKGKPTMKVVNPKCERKVKRRGKWCIQRLCIPIKLI